MLAVPMTDETPRILLTRPLAASRPFARDLAAEGLSVLESPVQAIQPVAFDRPHKMAGAIFTSRNGVEAVEGANLPCWCVGNATMQAAKTRGWQARSAAGDAEALFGRILADAPVGRLVHFRGAFARGNLCERLREAGFDAQEVVVYQQVSQPLSSEAVDLLNCQNPVILPIFSPRSAAQLVQQGPFSAPLIIVAMSDAVAGEAAALGPARLIVADKPDARSMVAAIKQVANTA